MEALVAIKWDKEREGQVCEKATEDLQIQFCLFCLCDWLQFISSHFFEKVKVSLWAHCQLDRFHIQFLTRAVSRKYSKICLTKFRNIGWKRKTNGMKAKSIFLLRMTLISLSANRVFLQKRIFISLSAKRVFRQNRGWFIFQKKWVSKNDATSLQIMHFSLSGENRFLSIFGVAWGVIPEVFCSYLLLKH